MNTNMTKVGFISFFQILSFAAMMQASSLSYNGPEGTKSAELTFAENKCQVKDYSGKTNKKILFFAQADNLKYLFRKDGISMQLNRPVLNKEMANNGMRTPDANSNQKLEIYWDGINKDANIYGAEEISAKSLKHATLQSSKDCEIRNFRKLFYTELYPGVDLRYYDRDNRLKYDMLVHPGFDFSEIKMRIEGVNELSVNSNGQLVISTNAGEIVEDAPLALQDGKPLFAKWVINEKTISLEIKNHNPEKELCIQASLFFQGDEYKM